MVQWEKEVFGTDGLLRIDVDLEKTAIPADRLDELKAEQLVKIREQRRRVYAEESDGLKLAADYDGVPDTAWRAKVAEIKARYPFPGSYR